MDVITGVARSFEAPPSSQIQAAWKADESAVLAVSFADFGSPNAALLIDPRTGDTLDLSKHFVGAFTDPVRTELAYRWTTDGEYVVVNTTRRGGFLVRPEPWKSIAVGERLVADLGFHLPSGKWPPTVHPLLVPGWVKVVADGKDYVVDYALETYLRLGWGRALHSPHPETTILPCGVRTAEIGFFGGISVGRIDLAAAKPLHHAQLP